MNFKFILLTFLSIHKVFTEQERCLEKSGYWLNCPTYTSFSENYDNYDYSLVETEKESAGKIVAS